MSSDIKEKLKQLEPFPLLGRKYEGGDYTEISMSLCHSHDLSNNAGLSRCIQDQLDEEGAKIGYGGYLEDRSIYLRSPLFQKGQEARSIHLGIDIWADAFTPVHAPLDGKVHSKGYNDHPSDYGATIILEHRLGDTKTHTLYGHLDYNDLQELEEGRDIKKGEVFCHLGDEKTNGGWVPHLHFQMILDMEDKKGDYPGVAAPSEINFYRKNCPDPVFLFSK